MDPLDQLKAMLPSAESGFLPYYLLIVSLAAMGNSAQNLFTLHYTRRLYTGLFVPNPAFRKSPSSPSPGSKNPEDSVHKLVPASPTGKDVEKASDQLTPLAARLFGTWTLITGIIRFYAAYDVHNRALYELSLLTHMLAAAHFTSEVLVFKTMRPSGPLLFPVGAGWAGTVWMAVQYGHYVN